MLQNYVRLGLLEKYGKYYLIKKKCARLKMLTHGKKTECEGLILLKTLGIILW